MKKVLEFFIDQSERSNMSEVGADRPPHAHAGSTKLTFSRSVTEIADH